MNPLQTLIGSSLSSVEFVQDYVQLRFDGPVLTIIAPYTITVKSNSYNSGGEGYRDALGDRIGREVTDAAVLVQERIELNFEDASKLAISLRPEDLTTPEAALLRLGSEKTYVW